MKRPSQSYPPTGISVSPLIKYGSHVRNRLCVLDSPHPASGLSVTLPPDATKGLSTVPHRPPQIPQHGTLSGVSRKLFPEFHQKLKRTVTMPRTATLLPADTVRTSLGPRENSMVVPYLSFPTIVGRNSAFHGLTEDQLEELGGIEFRALNMLMWAVPLVCHVFVASCPGQARDFASITSSH